MMTRTKRVMTIAAVVALAVTLAAPALALGPIELATPGAVTLELPEPYLEDLAQTAVTADVYQVASVDANGVFTLTGGFDTLAGDAETWNGGILSSQDQLEKLLAAATALVVPPEAEEPAEGEAPAEPFVPAASPDFTAEVTAEDGTVTVPALGLYLLVPQQAETTLWAYTFNPILLAVPSVSEREAGPEGGIPAEGEWLYEVTVEMKADRDPRLTDLEIVKYLATYDRNLGPATFVFDVVGRDENGQVVYQSTERLTFDDATGPEQRVRVENIPAGAEVTVTEVYPNAGDPYSTYTNTDGAVKVVVVDPGTLPEGQDVHRVAFSNDYSGGRTPDAAVENVFTMNDQGGWTWQSEKGSEEAAG